MKCSWNHSNGENKHFHPFSQHTGDEQGLSSITTTEGPQHFPWDGTVARLGHALGAIGQVQGCSSSHRRRHSGALPTGPTDAATPERLCLTSWESVKSAGSRNCTFTPHTDKSVRRQRRFRQCAAERSFQETERFRFISVLLITSTDYRIKRSASLQRERQFTAAPGRTR